MNFSSSPPTSTTNISWSPNTLIFTASNYNIDQTVTLTVSNGSIPSAIQGVFNVSAQADTSAILNTYTINNLDEFSMTGSQLTIDPSQEEGLRLASQQINSLIKKFEQNYSVRDKQDALAMCALQIASSKKQSSLNEEAFMRYHTANLRN